MTTVTVDTCLNEHLKDIYDCEIQFVDALNDMEKHATSDAVKEIMKALVEQAQTSAELLDKEGEGRLLEHHWIQSEGFVGQIRQNNARFNLVDDPLIRDLEILLAVQGLRSILIDKYEHALIYVHKTRTKELNGMIGTILEAYGRERPKITALITDFSDALSA